MTKEELANMYTSYLLTEGYAPSIDDDGDVTFKYEGGVYFIEIDEENPEVFRVCFPYFWSVENEEEQRKVTYAAHKTTFESKVAKIFPLGDNTWASVQLFCSPPEKFQTYFHRSMQAMQMAVELFIKTMHENTHEE